nr:suppressor of G2 allele of SKP1 [Ipomoea batatas]
MSPNNAELFSDRAQANIKLQNFTEAVDDANKAIELDPSMARAYLRKGGIELSSFSLLQHGMFLKLEEFQTAKAAVETEEAGEQANVESSTMNIAIPPESEGLGAAAAAIPKDAQAAAKPKYRHEFYQKPEEVVVTIFAKRIPAKNVSVDFGEQILSVTIDVPGEDAYTFQQRLFGKIIPANCRYEVMSTKIEIRLAKAQAIHWTSLEYSSEGSVVQKALVPSDGFKPSYPSSKPKKDWDKLEAQVKKEEKDEKLDGDAALNKFFRDIYKDADEDTRRAMMKSFVESNGTVLSTNWNEVGSKKVEGSPPDGMEMKKWEY